jgi:Protein of unknown function (DUF2924)
VLHHRNVSTKIDHLGKLSRQELRTLWEKEFSEKAPMTLGRDVLALAIAYARQERRYGGLAKPVARELERLLAQVLLGEAAGGTEPFRTPLPRTGTMLVREWRGTAHNVTVMEGGFLWNGKAYRSLSAIALAITGTKWNGPRFFGMRDVKGRIPEDLRGG